MKAPDAQLFEESGKAIGRHFAGPTWRFNHSSAVVGKVAARLEPPDKDTRCPHLALLLYGTFAFISCLTCQESW